MISSIFLRVFRIRLGHHCLSPIYESGQQLFQGIKSIPHPGCSHPGHSSDLMLIKLNKRIRETPHVRPISVSSHCPSAGTSCLVSGWETTSSPQGECPGLFRFPPVSAFSPSLSLSTLPLPIFLHRSLWPCSAFLCLTATFPRVLQCLNITVLSDDRCKTAYPNQIGDTMLCAGDQAGRDSCRVRLETSPFIQQIHTETNHVTRNLAMCWGPCDDQISPHRAHILE